MAGPRAEQPLRPREASRLASPVRLRQWDIGNHGVHELDIIRWGLDLDDHPTKVASMGGMYVVGGAQQYPQIHSTMFELAGVI